MNFVDIENMLNLIGLISWFKLEISKLMLNMFWLSLFVIIYYWFVIIVNVFVNIDLKFNIVDKIICFGVDCVNRFLLNIIVVEY